jgi:hypothetical protein
MHNESVAFLKEAVFLLGGATLIFACRDWEKPKEDMPEHRISKPRFEEGVSPVQV